MAYVRGVPLGSDGRVTCALIRFDRETGLGEEGWSTASGELRDGRTIKGPEQLPTIAIPMRIARPIDAPLHARAACHVEIDGRRASDDRHSDLHLGPSTPPDLSLLQSDHLDAVDCATGAPPHSEAPICVTVSHNNHEGLNSLYVRGLTVGVSCTFKDLAVERDPTTATIAAPLDDLGSSVLKVRLEAGSYQVRCQTDAAEHYPESDERNNFVTGQLDVLPTPAAGYAVRILDAEEVLGQRKYIMYRGEENGGGGNVESVSRFMKVRVENKGPHPIHGLRTTCANDSVRFEHEMKAVSAATALQPGATVDLELSPKGALVAGKYALECESVIVSPKVAPPPTARLSTRLSIPPQK